MLSGEEQGSRGAAGGAEFLKSGDVVGWNVSFWQCDPVTMFPLKERFCSANHIECINSGLLCVLLKYLSLFYNCLQYSVQ